MCYFNDIWIQKSMKQTIFVLSNQMKNFASSSFWSKEIFYVFLQYYYINN